MASFMNCLHRNLMSKSSFLRLVTCRQELVRHKGSQRVKAPPTAKDKEKWVPKTKRLVVTETALPKDYDEFVKRVPVDDVWLRECYPPPRCSYHTALRQHLELAAPDMHNNLEAVIYAQIQLDMTTKKKTKFMTPLSGTILLPNNFDDGTQNKVAAICKTAEDQQKALEAGATHVGGLDLIRQIERGDLRLDEIDSLCCHVDMLIDIAVIRKHLKDQFPSKKKGSLGTDMESMVRLFVNGRAFESVKQTDALATLTIALGKLSMPLDDLTENHRYIISLVSGLKSANVGRLIRSVSITAPPSNEVFLLDETETGQITKKEEPEADQLEDGEELEEEETVAVKK